MKLYSDYTGILYSSFLGKCRKKNNGISKTVNYSIKKDQFYFWSNFSKYTDV